MKKKWIVALLLLLGLFVFLVKTFSGFSYDGEWQLYNIDGKAEGTITLDEEAETAEMWFPEAKQRYTFSMTVYDDRAFLIYQMYNISVFPEKDGTLRLENKGKVIGTAKKK
ncbi:hypothetical protein [Bacillus atrophaeus]|uniref:hypothetical protein n=1 Tax=Bacillus atrophaeus TaxID=1452 RepID=UPI002E1F8D6D|nr:hypothetical protein [Bacillus atrophaeus]